jgi:hypothetical protein
LKWKEKRELEMERQEIKSRYKAIREVEEEEEKGHFPAISITSPDKNFLPRSTNIAHPRRLRKMKKKMFFAETEFEAECKKKLYSLFSVKFQSDFCFIISSL